MDANNARMQAASTTHPPLKVERAAKTLRELALENMRAAILSGHFKPGQRLVERALCEELDVSRSIVREVLRHLEAEALIETVPHQGPVVASLSLDQAAQIYDIRALLEGQAARVLARRADAPTLSALEAINARIQAAFRAQDHAAVVTQTTAFYQLMFERAGQGMAWDILRTLNARINRLRLMTIGSPERARDAAMEMQAILNALQAGDADAAQRAAEAHVHKVSAIARGLLT